MTSEKNLVKADNIYLLGQHDMDQLTYMERCPGHVVPQHLELYMTEYEQLVKKKLLKKLFVNKRYMFHKFKSEK